MGHTTAAILTLLGHFLFHELTVFVQAQHNFDPIIRQRGHLRNTKKKDGMLMRDLDKKSKQNERNLQFADHLSDCSAQFQLQIQFDEFAYEVSWELILVAVGTYGYSSIYGYSYDNSSNSGNITRTFCIPSGSYNFTMYDLADDGLCCDFGQGSYKVFVDDALIKEGGKYGSNESASFEVIKAPTVSPAPTATPTATHNVTCSSDEAKLAVEISEENSDGISWNVANATGALVLSSGPILPQTEYREYCLPRGVYTVTVNCESGIGGNYNVSADDAVIMQGFVTYGSVVLTFVTPNTPTQAPTSAPVIQCNLDESLFELTLMLDTFANDVFWNLTNSVKDLVLEGGNYSFDPGRLQPTSVNVCLPQSMYTFTITDAGRDGVCCFFSYGFYRLLVDGKQVRYSQGEYEMQEVTIFATQDASFWPTTSQQPTPSPTVTLEPTAFWTSARWTPQPTPMWTSFTNRPTPAPTTACGTDEATFELDIKFYYADQIETSWDLTDSVGVVLLSGHDYLVPSWEPNGLHKEACLSAGSYVFTIYNDDGNGLCCMHGPGMYKVTMDGVVVKKGGVFGSQESTNILSAPQDP